MNPPTPPPQSVYPPHSARHAGVLVISGASSAFSSAQLAVRFDLENACPSVYSHLVSPRSKRPGLRVVKMEVIVERESADREPLLKYRRLATKSLLFSDPSHDIKISCVAVHPKVHVHYSRHTTVCFNITS